MTNASKTTTTYAQRFAAKESELRGIAASLGRDDIFDRDLNGGASANSVAARSDQAIDDAISGVGWYLEEEHECDGEDGYQRDPRVRQYFEIVKFIGNK